MCNNRLCFKAEVCTHERHITSISLIVGHNCKHVENCKAEAQRNSSSQANQSLGDAHQL